VVFVEQFDQAVVVRGALVVADIEERHAELFGDAAAGASVADHHGRLGADLTVADGAKQGERRFGAVGRADGQTRASGSFLGGPDAYRQFGLATDFGQGAA
jgi:hypothetical protein